MPAIKKETTTPGPASSLAMSPATTYIPVPLHEPTPSDVKSNVFNNFLSEISSVAPPVDAFEMFFFLEVDQYFHIWK